VKVNLQSLAIDFTLRFGVAAVGAALSVPGERLGKCLVASGQNAKFSDFPVELKGVSSWSNIVSRSFSYDHDPLKK
jgi:hypothetical protein